MLRPTPNDRTIVPNGRAVRAKAMGSTRSFSWLRLDGFTLAIPGCRGAGARLLPCSGEGARLVGIGSGDRNRTVALSAGCAPVSPDEYCNYITLAAAPDHLRGYVRGIPASCVGATDHYRGRFSHRPLYVGLVFLCTLPSAVQASVIFTSIAGGNVPAALCSASPVEHHWHAADPAAGRRFLLQAPPRWHFAERYRLVVLHLLLPFLAGQLVQGRIDGWMLRHGREVRLVDRASVLLMVYGVFSAGTISGVWSRIPMTGLLVLAVVDGRCWRR